MTEENDLTEQLRGRALYLHNMGRVKSPDLMYAASDEIDRLRGLLGEPLRVIAVEAIREATGCPDLIGRDGVALTDKLLKKAADLLVPNA